MWSRSHQTEQPEHIEKQNDLHHKRFTLAQWLYLIGDSHSTQSAARFFTKAEISENLVNVDKAIAGHGLNAEHVFAARDGEGNCFFDFVDEQLGTKGFVSIEGLVEPRDDRLFDFSAAEPVTGGDKIGKVELLAGLLAGGEVNIEDLGSFFIDRQIDEEDLVEATFA